MELNIHFQDNIKNINGKKQILRHVFQNIIQLSFMLLQTLKTLKIISV